jgi:hypothetical protein
VDLAAAPDRRIDQAIDGCAARGLVPLLGVELEVEAVAVLGEQIRRDPTVRAQDGRDRGAGRIWQIPSSSTSLRASDRGKLSWTV